MKFTIDIDCTPPEARSFFGMPDVEPLNKLVMEEMTKRAKDNMDSLADPERMMAQWMNASGGGLEQFQNLMGAAMGAAGTKKK